MTDKLCSHAGSCEDNLRDHGGAFCANGRITHLRDLETGVCRDCGAGASMSEEMELRVERVALAIHDVSCGEGYDYMDFCRLAARAAIEALSRYPDNEGNEGPK
jgi:hypothetical protein